MSSKYNARTKGDKAEARKMLMEKAVEVTDNQFAVVFDNDDCGPHVCLYIERNTDDTLGYTNRVEGNVLGWRVIHMNVPNGYVHAYFNMDGTRRVIEE